MDCALPELMDVIKRVDVITINDEEASNFLENILLLRLLQNSNYGPKYVVIKKGSMELLFSIIRMFSLHQHYH
jgi:sugar/nucleoside kinase (ribokinase family)